MSRVRAKTWSGETWDDPDEDKLYDLLSEMNLVHRVLIVEPLEMPEPLGQHFIRVYLNDDKSSLTEYSEGGSGSDFQATVPAPFEMYGHDLVAEFIKSWARDDGEWRAVLPWTPAPAP